jgi:hypothetical protein
VLIIFSDPAKISNLWLLFAECEYETFAPVFCERGDKYSGSKSKFPQRLSKYERFGIQVNIY